MKKATRLVYVPLESYKERYTEYLSCKQGVFEQCLRELGVDFISIRPSGNIGTIKTGRVLDAPRRAAWGFNQTMTLIRMIESKQLDPDSDVIYFEDFWHPGFEMIPYTQSLVFGYSLKNHVPIASFSHAQTPDPHDFTHGMRQWMRPMEIGWLKANQWVFCAAEEMISQFSLAGMMMGAPSIMHATGQVFNGDWLYRMLYHCYPPDLVEPSVRSNNVVWSSRWDTEKDPSFFLKLIEYAMQVRKDVTFTVCTSSSHLKSDDPILLLELEVIKERYPENVFVKEGLTKISYFDILRSSKVQFNSALQDFVSYTLTEAALNGCAPLYPRRLTFPDALAHCDRNLYGHWNVVDALKKLNALIDSDAEDYSWVWKPYDHSVHRMMHLMGFDVEQPKTLREWQIENRERYGDLR